MCSPKVSLKPNDDSLALAILLVSGPIMANDSDGAMTRIVSPALSLLGKICFMVYYTSWILLMAAEFIHNPTQERIPKSADVVIIGGGPAGTAAAWALDLKHQGIKTVVIEQAENLGSGASTASLENFRTCWPWPQDILIEMMSLSFEVFSHPDDYFGPGAGKAINVKQRGYLYVGFNEPQANKLKQDVAYLNQLGLKHIEYLNEREMAYRYPYLAPGVVAAKFDPHAGWLDSNSLIQCYANASRNSKFLTGIKDSQILVRNEKVIGVKTANGIVHTEKVIVAAGAGSRQVGRTAGIEIPIVVTPRESFVTSYRHQQLPEDAPFIIGTSPYPYVRPEGQGAIFGWAYRRSSMIEPISPVEQTKDKRFPSVTLDLLARQFRHKNGDGFAKQEYLKGIKHQAGYYVTRDLGSSDRAIIGEWPGIEGLFLSVAHGGHGIMTSPASGNIIASIVIGQSLKPVFTKFSVQASIEEYEPGVL